MGPWLIGSKSIDVTTKKTELTIVTTDECEQMKWFKKNANHSLVCVGWINVNLLIMNIVYAPWMLHIEWRRSKETISDGFPEQLFTWHTINIITYNPIGTSRKINTHQRKKNRQNSCVALNVIFPVGIYKVLFLMGWDDVQKKKPDLELMAFQLI